MGCHFHIGLLRMVFSFADLDDGQCVQHGFGKPTSAALPGPASDIARAVSFGVPMRADGSSHDNGKEERCDETCYGIENDHGDICVRSTCKIGTGAVAHVGRPDRSSRDISVDQVGGIDGGDQLKGVL
jgi:hypothetical protein